MATRKADNGKVDLLALRDELRAWLQTGEVNQTDLMRQSLLSSSWIQQFKSGAIDVPQIDTLQKLIDYRHAQQQS